MNPFCIITITISLKSSDFFKTFKTVTNQKNKNFFYIIVASKADNNDIQNKLHVFSHVFPMMMMMVLLRY